MSGLVLSLFPGIGLLDMAFEEEGFCVVRGPDLLWGGDIRKFHPPAGKFDGVIGGPPCQTHSSMSHLCLIGNGVPGGHRYGDMIPEFARVVSEARVEWFLMENVKNAPTPQIGDYRLNVILLNNRWLGEDQNRLRKFCFGSRSGGRSWLSMRCSIPRISSLLFLPAMVLRWASAFVELKAAIGAKWPACKGSITNGSSA